MPPKLKVRVTNKMLDAFTPPELRMLCLLLGMPVMLSWKASPKERQTWFLEHLTKFVEIDLEKENWALYRKPTKEYCLALQAYASGDGPAPVFNPTMAEYDEEAKPIKYEEVPVWTRTDEEAEEEEKEEILEELKSKEVPTEEAPLVVEPIKENKLMSDSTGTKRFALKKTSLSNKAAAQEAAVENEKAEEVKADKIEEAVKKEVAEVKLPSVRAVSSNDDLDKKVQTIGDLVEKLCQIVTRQNKEIADLRALVGKQLEANTAAVHEAVGIVSSSNRVQDKALLVLLNNTVLADTPLDNLEDVLEV